MQVISRYCDTCGIKINQGDFKRELALEFEDKYYCKDCKEEVIQIIEHSKKKKKKKRSKERGAGGVLEEPRKKRKRSKDHGVDQEEPRKKRKRPKDHGVDQEEPRKKKKRSVDHSQNQGEKHRKKGRKRSAHPETDLASLVSSKGSAKASPNDKPKKNIPSKDLPGPPPEKKGFSTRSLMAIGGGLVLMMLISFLLLFSRTPKATVKKGPKKNQGTLEKEKKWLESAKKYQREHPTNYEKILNKWAVVQQAVNHRDLQSEINREITQCQNRFYKKKLTSLDQYLSNKKYKEALVLYFRYGDDLPLSPQKRRDLLGRIKALENSLFRLQADQFAPQLIKKATSYFEGGDYQKAVGTLMAFDQEIYASSPWQKKISRALQKFQSQKSAQVAQDQSSQEEKEKYRELIKEVDGLIAKKQYAQAGKLLRDFPVQYRKKYGAKLREKYREIQRKQSGDFDKKLAKVEWQILLAEDQDSLLSWTLGNGKGFSISQGVMKVENKGGKSSFRCTGQINWKSYLIEYEGKSSTGKTVLMVRFWRRRGKPVRYTLLEAPGTPSGWYKIQWLVQGQSYSFRLWKGSGWTGWKRVNPMESRPHASGAIGFVATKGCSFQIRKMRIKVLSKASAF